MLQLLTLNQAPSTNYETELTNLEKDMPKYLRNELPQWTIKDVIKHDYSYYFALMSKHTLKPSQQDRVDEVKILRKQQMLQVGQFDPIITDCDFNIVCGHHRHEMMMRNPNMHIVPVICLEGATIDMIVNYYNEQQLHDDEALSYRYDAYNEDVLSHHAAPHINDATQTDWIDDYNTEKGTS